MDYFEEWNKHPKNERNGALMAYISKIQDLSGITEQSLKDLKTAISRFPSKLSEKWNTSQRLRDRFLANNMEWLQGDYTFNVSCDQVEACSSSSKQHPPGPGRPTIAFENASSKTKRRRVEDLIVSRTSEELLAAAEISSRLSGNRNVAKIIKEASECEKLSDRQCSNQKQQRCLARDEALAYYVDSKSTSHSYKQTRKWSMLAGHQVFPSFDSLRKAKKACLPSEDNVEITETRADIKLQAVLDKTAHRLISAQREVITCCPSFDKEASSFTLISKWGCDGSSGHSTYKQKFSDTGATDEYLFVFSLVPLQLRDESGHIAWQNPRPSSTMYCRPIKFIFSKESKVIR